MSKGHPQPGDKVVYQSEDHEPWLTYATVIGYDSRSRVVHLVDVDGDPVDVLMERLTSQPREIPGHFQLGDWVYIDEGSVEQDVDTSSLGRLRPATHQELSKLYRIEVWDPEEEEVYIGIEDDTEHGTAGGRWIYPRHLKPAPTAEELRAEFLQLIGVNDG